ncbi:hypothetical protein M422DRAFT_34841 [Sphaerobolus stellatus SS14]|uniref:Uncharacterized protein n=1 Tax=Sphaerobolus stellatus (strain SS14) TaxID=990650 RepID=A0A0C9VBM5_SPHS4|nr:hypothetical protein M422DRAFT_34841 [Sphaerobolus stellatus SS14]
MGQYWEIVNLDGQFTYGSLGKYGESYMDDYEWLIRLLVPARQSKGMSFTQDYKRDVQIPELPVGAWENDRLICLGDYANDLPVGCLQDSEVETLQRLGLGSSNINDITRGFTPIANRASGVVLGPAWAVANLSKREYFSIRTLEELKIKAIESNEQFSNISAGNILLSRVCWSTDSSTSMSYGGFRHTSGKIARNHRGPWAGDRFSIISLDDAELSTFKDVTEEVYAENLAMWASNSYRSPPEDFGFVKWAEVDDSDIYAHELTLRDDPEASTSEVSEAEMSLPGQSWEKVKVKKKAVVTINPNQKELPQEILEKIFRYVFDTIPSLIKTQIAEESNAPSKEVQQQEVDPDPSQSDKESDADSDSDDSSSGDCDWSTLDAILNFRLVCKAWSQALVHASQIELLISSNAELKDIQVYLKQPGIYGKALDIVIKETLSEDFWNIVMQESARWKKIILHDSFLDENVAGDEILWATFCNFSRKSNLTFSTVIEIRLHTERLKSRQELDNILRCPNLKRLEIDLSGGLNPAEDISEQFVLSKLRDLCVFNPTDRVISYLASHIPSELDSLTLADRDATTSTIEATTANLFAPFAVKPLINVRELTISGRLPGFSMKIEQDLITALPNIQKLSIVQISPGERILFCHLLHNSVRPRLKVSGDCMRCIANLWYGAPEGVSTWQESGRQDSRSCSDILWPKLDTLFINFESFLILVDFLYRRDILGVPIKYLYFVAQGTAGGLGRIRLNWLKQWFAKIEYVDKVVGVA